MVEGQTDEYPAFLGPIVQWPRYAASYQNQTFTISPVPTDTGSWVVMVEDWGTDGQLYATVEAAIDAGMAWIKGAVDQSAQQVVPEEAPEQSSK